MPYVMNSPSGTVYLGHVPWNPDYKHVYWEGAVNKQLIIDNFMNVGNGGLTTDHYSYIREDSNIKVPFNAETLYGINYCMYQNLSTGMVFCCFVTSITYLNENTSLLHLQEDVWHTWGGRISWNRCLISREHVNDDTRYMWRVPEPDLSLEPRIQRISKFTHYDFDTVVVGTNAIPHLKGNLTNIFGSHTEDDFDGSDAVAGGWYGNIYSGLKYYAFTRNDGYALTHFLDNLNMCGAAESIGAMFIVPNALLTMSQTEQYVVSGYGGSGREERIAAPTVVSEGYVPHNNKCFTFPYCYARITDFDGGSMDLKFEDSTDTNGDIVLTIEQGLDSTATLYATAKKYMGAEVDYSHTIALAQNPQCAWVYEAYQNWLAQNSSTIQAKREIVGAELLIAGGLLVAGAALATGAAIPAIMAAGGVPVLEAGAGLTAFQKVGLGVAAAGATKGVGAVESGVMNEAQVQAQSKKPNHISGSSSSNSLQALSRNQGGYMVVYLQNESARRLDAYFDMYGYAIDTIKYPNYEGREKWNFVKTVGANMGGDIPADRLALINYSLDNGVTFWHVTSVGDYYTTNDIVQGV